MDDDTIYKIDASTGIVIDFFPTGSSDPEGLAYGAGFLWEGGQDTIIYKIDPETGAVITSFSAPGMDVHGLAFDGAYLWSDSRVTELIYKIDVGAAPVDSDSDGVPDTADNCSLQPNADQPDTDDDDIGNVCDADVSIPTNDCIVNFLDLLQYRANFFQNGDFDTGNNGDNITNFLDLLVVRDQFFGPPGPSANGCN